ncbi:hypothetical protein [Pseudomonas mangiferae]|uniref:hypothetical protein n=1 Tax=Pseudomonas mangiferae TaxID=2593654 RepID=UPI0015B64226|nr:hypothetical protein [Pseudomonas mangiferae]
MIACRVFARDGPTRIASSGHFAGDRAAYAAWLDLYRARGRHTHAAIAAVDP